MKTIIIILLYFIGIPLGIILWKIAVGGININYNEFTNPKGKLGVKKVE